MVRKVAGASDNPPRLDAVKRLRGLLGPATQKHVDFKEKLKAHYVTTERDQRLKAEMDMLVENVVERQDLSREIGSDNRGEGTAVAVIAESGAGKTRAMRHYLKSSRFFAGYGDPDAGCPLITVGVKAPCTLRNLGMATLRAAGYLSRTEKRQNEAWPQAQFQIQDQQILFVNYEEAQRIIQQANSKERKQVVETLAGLMTDPVWSLYLVLSGLPELEDLFDQQFLENPTPAQRKAHMTLRRRTRFVPFSALDLKADRKDIDRGIKEYEKLGGVSLALLKEPEMRARLHHAGAQQLGLFWELTVAAIDGCVRAGRKVVTKDDYSDSYAAKTLEPIELNPFEVDHWETIDTSVIQRRLDDEDDQVETPARGKKGKPRTKLERHLDDT
ncbi:hypothetical protein ABH973_005936 [Bradyrhizobium ottawaense]|uniref:AAA family ATPase n=1 Tax=Bradyrhizobium ottawaense TaxID=931866 RepID=UPI0035110303